MTIVYCEKKGDQYTITANGHSTGSPEVCAAVSGLLYALAGYVENEKDEKDGVQSVIGRMANGNFFIVFHGKERAEAVYNMTLIGLLQIEKSHPEYIKVERREIS